MDALSRGVGLAIFPLLVLVVRLQHYFVHAKDHQGHCNGGLVNASAVRVPGIAAGLRLGAVGNFIAGVAIALAWNTVDTIGSDALLEFFDV